MKSISFLIILSFLSVNSVYAHDAQEQDTGPWTNNFSLGYNKTDGNSDTSLLNLKVTSVYDQDDDNIRLEAEHSFGENDDETNVDYSKGLAEYKHIMTDMLYTGIGLTAQRDEIADVKYRYLVSPVLGYYLYKKESDFFSLEVGPAYLFEEVAGVTDDYLAPKIGQRLEFQITETAKIFQFAEAILSAEDSDNYLIQAEAGIETSISESINLVLKVRNNYDNQPGAGKEKNDLALLSGIGVDF